MHYRNITALTLLTFLRIAAILSDACFQKCREEKISRCKSGCRVERCNFRTRKCIVQRPGRPCVWIDINVRGYSCVKRCPTQCSFEKPRCDPPLCFPVSTCTKRDGNKRWKCLRPGIEDGDACQPLPVFCPDGSLVICDSTLGSLRTYRCCQSCTAVDDPLEDASFAFDATTTTTPTSTVASPEPTFPHETLARSTLATDPFSSVSLFNPLPEEPSEREPTSRMKLPKPVSKSNVKTPVAAEEHL